MKKIFLFGAGSQTSIICEIIKQNKLGKVALLYDPTLQSPSFQTDISFSNNFKDVLKSIDANEIEFFHVCIGNHHGYQRAIISDFLLKLNLKPLSIISDTALIDYQVNINLGALIMPGAILRHNSSISNFTVINTGAIVEHESMLGKGVHIMSGAVVLGRVHIDSFASIGANSTILPDIHIGEGAIVGAGAVVTKNILPRHVVIGSPAKYIKLNTLKDPIIKKESL